jgi:hypothetical protein
MSVRGRGDALPFPATPGALGLPVTVQLRNDAGGCWGATFSAPAVNDGSTFSAKSDAP